MTNLGAADQNDGIILCTTLTNINSTLGDATDIQLSVVDDNNNVRFNDTNASHISLGTYGLNVFLDSNVFNTGIHYAIWTGYTTNVSFYHEDVFTIEGNRLIQIELGENKVTWENDVIDKLDSIAFNTSETAINVSSIVINVSEVIVDTQDIEEELQANRTGIYSIDSNVSWIPGTYPNLSAINDNTSAINSNLSSFPYTSANLSAINENTSFIKRDIVNLSYIRTSLDVIDDWDESDRCAVNLSSTTETKLSNLSYINENTSFLKRDIVNLSYIRASVEIMDTWDESSRCKVNLSSTTEVKLDNLSYINKNTSYLNVWDESGRAKVSLSTTTETKFNNLSYINENTSFLKRDIVNLSHIRVAVEIIDDWDDNDRCAVNLSSTTEIKLDNLSFINANTSSMARDISTINTDLDNLSYINENTSFLKRDIVNLSYINANISASLVEATSIDANISYGFRFSGRVYHNFSGGNNNASRFESSPLLLRDFAISCKTRDMNLGDSNNQSFVLTEGSTWGGTLLDLNSLWFRNSSSGNNGYLAIIATRE